MNYQASRIPLTCDEPIVRNWAEYMTTHIDEVTASLMQEGVRHEQWYLGKSGNGIYLIGVMDVRDVQHAQKVAKHSRLGVDHVHREFKRHWDIANISSLKIKPGKIPEFKNLELLFEARV